MKKAMTILYEVHGNLYVNLTNKCPCACTLKLAAIFFCIPKEPLIMKRYQISISFNFGFTPYIEGE